MEKLNENSNVRKREIEIAILTSAFNDSEENKSPFSILPEDMTLLHEIIDQCLLSDSHFEFIM